MRIHLAPVLALLLATYACGGDSGDPNLQAQGAHEADGDDAAGAANAAPDADVDEDGIPDAVEDELMTKFSPVYKLGPKGEEKDFPANVDWYLQRARMRFEHPDCDDHDVLATGKITMDALLSQTHATTDGDCKHTKTLQKSTDKNNSFFITSSDSVHRGAPQSEWRLYVHVKKSVVEEGGYDIQYWIFYPYNTSPDPVGLGSHEGDWERVTVTANKDKAFHSVYYAAHAGGARLTTKEVKWVGETHPVVYVAKGSHASFKAKGDYKTEVMFVEDHTYDNGVTWDTSKDSKVLVNVGEVGNPRNGATWLKYTGRWGMLGKTDLGDGPRTPSVQGAWNKF